MTAPELRIRPARTEDLPAIARLRGEAFELSRSGPVDPASLTPQDRWVGEVDGEVAATAAAIPMGQRIGGRVVPSLAVKSVAVSSGRRGSGLGGRLLAGVLRQARESGAALACLYPSVTEPYRRSGFELAGSWTMYGAPLSDFADATGVPALAPWGDEDLPAVRECYASAHAFATGPLDRSEQWWRTEILAEHRDPVVHRWLLRDAGTVTGYLVYCKDPNPDRDMGDYCFDVSIKDVAWTTPEASHALMAHLAGHRGLGINVIWPGPPNDLWRLMLGGRVTRIARAYGWMLRALDPLTALKSRGWSSGVRGSVALCVHGPGDETSVLRLEVEDGVADVVAASSATADVDAGALAAMYSGHVQARDLVRAGRLRTARDCDVATLETLFAGPPPWMPEFF